MRKQHILYIVVAIVFILSLVFIENNNSSNNNVSALSYESSVGIGFTFNPTLSINISSSDLVISNLVPGSSSDSNIINVSVLTNASHGYTLAIDTNNENLVHNGNNVNSIFSSIATNADLASLTTDNTWGYSYKLSSNNTWSNYNGLPLHTNTSTTIINTDNQVSKPIDFKIGAKASSTQASGTYTGTINFIAVSKPTPKTIDDIVYMQTFGELVSTDLQSVKNSMVLNQDYILKDIRDEKEYYVTRLEDGNVWMTQNLDLDLSSDNPLTSGDTDLNDTVSTAYQDGYNIENNIVKWTPERSTITPEELNSETWTNDNFNPYSYDRGLIYPSNNTPETTAGNHGLSGNYYNWTAAIASNDSSNYYNNATNSICPKGWRLPIVISPEGTYEFGKLLYIYQITTSENGGYAENGFNKIMSAPLWFITSGTIGGGSIDEQYYGYYWSAFSISTKFARSLRFYSNRVNPSDNTTRGTGLSVRCLAK